MTLAVDAMALGGAALKGLLVIFVVLQIVPGCIYLERKICAYIQGRRGPNRFPSCDGLFVRFARTPGASVPPMRLRLADARAINARLPPYAARLVPKDASANYYWSCFFRR